MVFNSTVTFPAFLFFKTGPSAKYCALDQTEFREKKTNYKYIIKNRHKSIEIHCYMCLIKQNKCKNKKISQIQYFQKISKGINGAFLIQLCHRLVSFHFAFSVTPVKKRPNKHLWTQTQSDVNQNQVSTSSRPSSLFCEQPSEEETLRIYHCCLLCLPLVALQ